MPKSTRPKSGNVPTLPPLETQSVAAIVSGVTEGDIALRAFERYRERGGEHGHDVDDWLNAERELHRTSAVSAA